MLFLCVCYKNSIKRFALKLNVKRKDENAWNERDFARQKRDKGRSKVIKLKQKKSSKISFSLTF